MRRLLAILVMAATAQGAVYYVDSSYGTGGNGSESTPWDQLADLPSLSAGDTVRLKRGSVFREGLAITADNVTVEAYGTGDDPGLQTALAAEPNLPVLCPNPDSGDWTATEGVLYRLGGWTQPNGYPIRLEVVSGPGAAMVTVNPDGTWTFRANVSLEWQVWRVRATNVLPADDPQTPASRDVLVFVRGTLVPNLPPILYFIFDGGTA